MLYPDERDISMVICFTGEFRKGEVIQEEGGM